MQHLKLTLIFLLFVSVVYSQSEPIKAKNDTVYFHAENGFIVVGKKEKAEGFGMKSEFNDKLHLYKIWYLQSETPMAEYEVYDKKYTNAGKSVSAIIPVKDGRYQEWYISGEKKVLCNYSNDKLNGDFQVFYKNGNVKRSEKWNNGEWISGECFDENGNKTDYCSYQELASFIGGLSGLYNYIGKSLRYPIAAQRAGIQGKVVVHFFINTDGSITDVKVVKSINEDLDAEAVRIIKNMPNWKPGRFEGQLVRNEFTLPINFKLE
jgi:TonB family protein